MKFSLFRRPSGEHMLVDDTPRKDDAMSDPDPDTEVIEREPDPFGPDDATQRDACIHCRGTGYVLTVNDLLRESVGLLGSAGDDVVRRFYENLLRAAPDLAGLFPSDLLDPFSGGPGKVQRDKLLGALIALSQTYDPGNPESLRVLDTHLAAYGRSHINFVRPDGVQRPASVSEYHAVRVTLLDTLHEVAGEMWRPEYDDAWTEAYEYAAQRMIASQVANAERFAAPRFPRRER